MKYIVHRRFKTDAICGRANIPATSECESVDGIIYYQGKPICFETSENAHQFFAENEDGCGMERGKLTQAIQDCLSIRDNDYQSRWDMVWEAAMCWPYKREDYDDFWLWNHKFFHAPVDDLKRIAKLIGAKEGK